ncbi:metallophosphoesterase [Rhizobium leguminosarum]|uniref:metallophosphoesterase n=1 Tax=Rhizobium leguminosarum TaxID=384 RepID=UPI001442792B|nr:metallophosphoesterase [Rhizobium leguminosarum]
MSYSVLHLSDLHFSNKHAAQSNMLRDAFWSDLNQLMQDFGKPNVVVFSGDIVNNPDEEDVYLHAIDKFFDPLAEKTGVKASNFIFCPGNHDISWKALKKNELFTKALAAEAANTELISRRFSSGELDDFARSLSAAFFDFCDYLGAPWRSPFFNLYEVAGLRFGAINMAFSGSLGGSTADRGKLFFPVTAAEQLIADNGGKLLGFVGHFPLEEMNEAHTREVRPIVQSEASYSFFGHVHNAQPTARLVPGAKIVELQAGALHASKDFFKGYSLLEIEDDYTKVHYRTYFDGRREFDVATNVSAGGLFYPDDKSRGYWESRKPGYTKEQLERYLSDSVYPQLERDYKDTLSKQPLSEIFVFPTFGEPNLADDSGDDPKDITRGEVDVKASDDHICCHFPDETGSTSFLRYLALEASRKSEAFSVPRIPLYMDVRDAKSYPAAVLRAIKAAMPDSDHTQFGWKAREIDQPLLILVDNYNPRQEAHAEWLSATYKLLPKARFVLCAKSPFAAQQPKSRPEINLPFAARNWSIYPFNRSEVRALVNRIDLPENLDRNLIVEEIISKFLTIGIPLSGPLISMYLMVLKERKSYSPINTAAVIENFIEVTLGKASTGVVFLGEFDYKDQIRVLCITAIHFCKNNLASISYDALYDIIKNYHEEIGVKKNSADIIDYFVEKNIFERLNNDIYFRYKIFHSYLVAVAMEDEDFRDYILDQQNINQYISELDIYFGINRKDRKALEKIARLYNELKNEIIEQFGSYVSNAEKEIFDLPRAKDADEFLEKISQHFSGELDGMPDKQRDEAVGDEANISAVDGRARGFIQTFKKSDVIDPLFKWAQILACYSVCVKNSSELTKEEKARHIDTVLDGWGMITILAYKVVALILEKGSVEVGSYHFNFGARRSNDPKMLRHVVANVPRIVSQFARMYVASDKLDAILHEAKLSSFPDFLRVSLLVDMRAGDYLKVISEFRRKNTSKPSMLEALMWKLRDSFLRFGLDKLDVNAFKQQVAELNADILNLKGHHRNTAIAQSSRSLDQQRIQSRARFNGRK